LKNFQPEVIDLRFRLQYGESPQACYFKLNPNISKVNEKTMVTSQKYALITGASSGIGFELAKLFAKDEYNLIIVGRDAQTLAQTAEQLKTDTVDVIPIVRDLFNRSEVFSLYEEITSRRMQVDVLVNNAGQGVYGEFIDIDINRELNIIDLNVSALTILTKCFLKDMTQRNSGKILNLASIASKVPGPWQAVYHATKAYVLSFTEAVREEVSGFEITVTALMPGVTDTDFFNKADMLESKAVQDKSAMADPADVALDGYNALMADKDKVISGFKNRMQMAMSAALPDSMNAHLLNEQQKPVGEE
jgi:short-subunit dehydrogenase